MNNKLIDLIVKYNELTPKEKELFSEVIGIEVKKVPDVSLRSLEEVLEPFLQEQSHRQSNPAQRYNDIPTICPSRNKVQIMGNTLYSIPDKDIKY